MKRTIAVLAGVATFLLAGPASAHIAVSATDSEPGAEISVLTFVVPTESATASTTEVAVQLPKFETVTVEPIPGWTATTRKAGDTVTEVDWTADSGGVKPGEFAEFAIRVGPLPDADSVDFAAIQTYSDGTSVAWNQTAAPGSDAEPEHPKPELVLSTPAAAPKAASTTGATVLSVVALVVAAAALGLAVVGNARRRPA